MHINEGLRFMMDVCARKVLLETSRRKRISLQYTTVSKIIFMLNMKLTTPSHVHHSIWFSLARFQSSFLYIFYHWCSTNSIHAVHTFASLWLSSLAWNVTWSCVFLIVAFIIRLRDKKNKLIGNLLNYILIPSS